MSDVRHFVRASELVEEPVRLRVSYDCVTCGDRITETRPDARHPGDCPACRRPLPPSLLADPGEAEHVWCDSCGQPHSAEIVCPSCCCTSDR